MTQDRPWYTYRQAAKRTGKHVQTMKKWRQRSSTGWSWDDQGRRVVEHHALLAYWRGCIERDNRNRGITQDVPLFADDFFETEDTTGDTP
ncbi:hypothetical protein [Leucobacter sp.]